MQDKDTELNYYPKSWLSLQGAGPVLCIAPHPDDEVLGCGGALMLLARQGAHVQSLILTRGDKAPGTASQANAAARLQESIAAARIMGTLPPQCLDFKDRELCYSEPLISAILQGLQSLPPAGTGESAWLFLPSLSEPHPDHQAAALAGMAAAQRWGQPVTVLFYEVGAPMHPNTYLDITQVAEQKWQAVAQFTSQLGLENYDSHSRAMATLRATLVGLTSAGHSAIGRTGSFGPEVRVRHIIGLDPGRRGVAVADEVEAGMPMAFCQRHARAARADLVRICAEIREALEPEEMSAPLAASLALTEALSAPHPQRRIAGAVYVSCTGRGGHHFGGPSAELQVIRHALGEVPLVGFFAGGEIAGHQLYGYTGVLTVFTEDAA